MGMGLTKELSKGGGMRALVLVDAGGRRECRSVSNSVCPPALQALTLGVVAALEVHVLVVLAVVVAPRVALAAVQPGLVAVAVLGGPAVGGGVAETKGDISGAYWRSALTRRY